ncbi:methyl-accepting chemotaxis protein [Candidatus Methylospira mobilis]|nr:methyl-accepting chemotaxis protein [Candidatus Methylospira mobilis]
MRTNLPVTNVEYPLKETSFIVSKTDLKGIIIYVNAEFIETSGFTEQELIGQPHNLVRHPDMPEEAFADMWATLQSGKPWSGVVKNRCKNGDFYWVLTHVTPIIDDGVAVGYLSVRHKPSQEQIDTHTAVYRAFKEGRQGHLRIHEGKAVKPRLLENFRWIKRISIKARVVLLVAIGAALPAMIGAIGFYNVYPANFRPELIVATLSICIGLLVAVGRSLILDTANNISFASRILGEMAQGHYWSTIEVDGYNEIGRLLYAVKSTQIRLGFEVADARRIATEATRVVTALDTVGTCVMIADNKGGIIYLNRAIENMFAVAESDIRKDLPHFDRTRLIGASINNFHRHPGQQIELLKTFTAPHRAEMTIGGRTFALCASPVINAREERLGAVVEWRDRTQEIATEQEIGAIVEAAARGDFSRRMALTGKTGFFRQLGEGMNRLIETSANSLNEIVHALEALALGDLTGTIHNEYQGTFGQLKDDFNATVAQLTGVTVRIKEATAAINDAALEISRGNNDLSGRTRAQASSLEQTTASMAQMTLTVQRNAENARQANQLAAGASTIALQGGDVMGRVVSTMSSISESSKKIADIIGVIEGIAFQTNILALNAAVEAARAGEQGRGFAVVAGEVRNLAQRSAEAAKEIKTLIIASVEQINTGAGQVNQAGQTISDVVRSVQRVTDIMSEISAASAEQRLDIEQINQAINTMDYMTQQNVALVEQAAAAAESMEMQTRELSGLVRTFRTAS